MNIERIQYWLAVAASQQTISKSDHVEIRDIVKKLEGCVVVPESELTNTFYWPDSEYVVDCPFDYDFELDKGEIQVIEKWQRTKSTKIYFANIYKDEESFEIKEFPSLEAAQEAVKENDAYLEAKDFFDLVEAARGGNEF